MRIACGSTLEAKNNMIWQKMPSPSEPYDTKAAETKHWLSIMLTINKPAQTNLSSPSKSVPSSVLCFPIIELHKRNWLFGCLLSIQNQLQVAQCASLAQLLESSNQILWEPGLSQGDRFAVVQVPKFLLYSENINWRSFQDFLGCTEIKIKPGHLQYSI